MYHYKLDAPDDQIPRNSGMTNDNFLDIPHDWNFK